MSWVSRLLLPSDFRVLPLKTHISRTLKEILEEIEERKCVLPWAQSCCQKLGCVPPIEQTYKGLPQHALSPPTLTSGKLKMIIIKKYQSNLSEPLWTFKNLIGSLNTVLNLVKRETSYPNSFHYIHFTTIYLQRVCSCRCICFCRLSPWPPYWRQETFQRGRGGALDPYGSESLDPRPGTSPGEWAHPGIQCFHQNLGEGALKMICWNVELLLVS